MINTRRSWACFVIWSKVPRASLQQLFTNKSKDNWFRIKQAIFHKDCVLCSCTTEILTIERLKLSFPTCKKIDLTKDISKHSQASKWSRGTTENFTVRKRNLPPSSLHHISLFPQTKSSCTVLWVAAGQPHWSWLTWWFTRTWQWWMPLSKYHGTDAFCQTEASWSSWENWT